MTTSIDAEVRIVWAEPAEALVFVREACRPCSRPSGPVELQGHGRVVAFAELAEDAPRDPVLGWHRRVWYVRPDDEDPALPPPVEAIDPKSIAPRVPSKETTG